MTVKVKSNRSILLLKKGYVCQDLKILKLPYELNFVLPSPPQIPSASGKQLR